jgi:phosphatidylglycerophosphate synthase
MPGAWSTRANALTLLRLLAAPPLVVAVRNDAFVPAAALFAIAVATDFADGWVARRYGEVSALGGLVDHAVDATFVTCGTAALASTGVLPGALPVLIAIAFLEYAWRARALERHRVLRRHRRARRTRRPGPRHARPRPGARPRLVAGRHDPRLDRNAPLVCVGGIPSIRSTVTMNP